eukprot:6200513-Lingulodinium_polyedra.AAC.1
MMGIDADTAAERSLVRTTLAASLFLPCKLWPQCSSSMRSAGVEAACWSIPSWCSPSGREVVHRPSSRQEAGSGNRPCPKCWRQDSNCCKIHWRWKRGEMESWSIACPACAQKSPSGQNYEHNMHKHMVLTIPLLDGPQGSETRRTMLGTAKLGNLDFPLHT